MGYDYSTGHCDENCADCNYVKCVEHPHHKDGAFDGVFEGRDVVCPNCGETFTQDYPRQRFCCAACQQEYDDATVSALTWVRRRGYKSKADFVAEHGLETWKAIGGQ